MRIVDYDTYSDLYKSVPIKGIENVKAFYNHTVKAFCKDPRALFISLDDHIVHRGDGVFESITCRNRKIINLDKHLERLAESLKAIQLNLPFDWEEMRALTIQTAQVGDFENGSIKLLIGRGRGGFGINPKECHEASVYIVASESKPINNSFWSKGMTAARSSIPVKQKYLAKIKSTNYLPNVLMTIEATEKNVDFVFAFDENNFLAEAAICNVGMYKDNVFYFPRFEHILSGTTVLLAIEKAKEFGRVELCDISEEMLESADEIFAIGSTVACVSIVEYNNAIVGEGKVGPMSIKLKNALLENYNEEGVEY